jgi:hypothetical protein
MDPYDTDYSSSGYETDSTSLASAVNEYVFENGTYLVWWPQVITREG